MKAGTHPQTLTHQSKTQPQIGVLKVLAQLRQSDYRHKLAWCDSHQLRYEHPNHGLQYVVEQMVTVITPLRHVSLRMVDRVQSPPPVPLVLCTVQPVIHKIKQHQIQHKTHDGAVCHTGPPVFKMESAKTGAA